MLFSIIVPVYNVEKYIEKCLSSLKRQIKFDEYEVIVVNDGSKDGSEEIVRHFCDTYDNFKLINQKNGGLSDARNTGVKNSKGDYIIFLDGDDFFSENALEKLSQEIKQHNFPDIIYTYYTNVVGNQNKVKHNFYSQVDKLYDSKEFMKYELKRRWLPIAACFGVYKRTLLIDNDLMFCKGILHEDERWSPIVLLKSQTVYTSDASFYHYVRHENSITTQKDRTQNGIDIIYTAVYLQKVAIDIEDKELRKLFLNLIAMLYLKGTTIGNLYRKGYKKYIDRKFPIKNACTKKDIIKSLLFLISPVSYKKVESIVTEKIV